MSYAFEKLPQLVDMRGKLPSKGKYPNYGASSKTHRVWHHSLTKKHLAGSTAEAFARYHVNTHGWPGVGYHFIIEPKNVVKGRARIVWAHDIGVRSYHVGDSNRFSLGICVAGDYRYDELDEPTLRSIAELHDALVKDGIGKYDRSHHEMPGYSWKECCVYDYRKAVKWQGDKIPKKSAPLPNTYVIQEGDTFWGIANGIDGLTVEDLIAANPGVDPKRLRVGQVINLGKAKGASKGLLGHGDRGPDVGRLQDQLRTLGFDIAVDNIFGPRTEAAVKDFQQWAGITVDGIVGPNTRRKLTEATVYPGHYVDRGDRGKWVEQVQRKVNTKVDGIFGPKTERAVREWQKKNGLNPDGIVGPKTWAKMFN